MFNPLRHRAICFLLGFFLCSFIRQVHWTEPPTPPSNHNPQITPVQPVQPLQPVSSSNSHLAPEPLKPEEKKEGIHVLILTPIKNGESSLENYWKHLDDLNFEKKRISIAFLISDSSDKTEEKLKKYVDSHRSQYESIEVYEKSYQYKLSIEDRHGFGAQRKRRTVMAQSRNYLLFSALRPHHTHVMWTDVDLDYYPPNTLRDLIDMKLDVVVPVCMMGTGAIYDRNNWHETPESLKIKKGLAPDFLMLEGHHEFTSHRKQLGDYQSNDPKEKIELHGIGGTFIVVNAEVHRQGVIFPAFLLDHQLETEGFAVMANMMGFKVYGLPGYKTLHN